MKTKRRTTTALLLVALMKLIVPVVPAPSTAAGLAPTDEDAVKLGLAQIPANIGQVGTVVGVVNGNNLEVFYYGGVNKSPGAPKPTATTLFAIGSITKTMTATLLALYDKRGLIHIPSVPPGGKFNQRVELRPTLLQDVLPPGYTLPCPRKTITLLDLADHHSGLPRNGKVTDSTVADVYTDLSYCPGCVCPGPQCSFCKPPGSYCYSNFAYFVLGHVLANVAHASTWAELNYSQIMQPLGMADTNVKERYTAAQNFAGRVAKGYMKDGSGNPILSGVQGSDMKDNPAGGLWSTPDDMMRWLVYNMSERASPGTISSGSGVTSTAQAELLSLLPALHYPRLTGPEECPNESPASHDVTVGLAWQMMPSPGSSSSTIVYKGGSVAGFRAYMAFDSSSPKGVFLLLNYSLDDSNLKQVGNTILRNLP